MAGVWGRNQVRRTTDARLNKARLFQAAEDAKAIEAKAAEEAEDAESRQQEIAGAADAPSAVGAQPAGQRGDVAGSSGAAASPAGAPVSVGVKTPRTNGRSVAVEKIVTTKTIPAGTAPVQMPLPSNASGRRRPRGAGSTALPTRTARGRPVRAGGRRPL